MKTLIRFSMKNAAAIFILIAVLVAGGGYAVSNMNMEKYPAVDIPFLDIEIVYPGASPKQAMDEIGKPLEEALRNIKNVDNLFTGAQSNVLSATVQFSMDADVEAGERAVREAVSKIKLPDSARAPEISPFKLDPEIYSIAIFGGTNEQLRSFVEGTLKPELQSVRGIDSIEVKGLKDLNINIRANPRALEQNGVTLDQLSQMIKAGNISIPIGKVSTDQQDLPIRIDSTFQSVDDVANLPITLRNPNAAADGKPLKVVKLKELADVTAETDESAITRFNGQPAVKLSVIPELGQDAVTIAKQVKQSIGKVSFPAGVSPHMLLDRSIEIEQSVNSMLREVLLGVVMAVIVTMLFLRNIRSTLIAVISIPLSMFASFIVLSNLGYTLNTLTLAAIAVAVGRVVDDSIVVMENIFRRVSLNKQRDLHLVENATREVASAITSSTLTTVAVFLPLAFVPGIVGKFFVPLAWTIVISLLFSLLVAITVVPLLSKLFLLHIKHNEPKENFIQNIYRSSLKWALGHRFLTLLIAILLLGGSLGLLPLMGFNFLPSETVRQYKVEVHMPIGSSLANTEKVVAAAEDKIKQREGITFVQSQIENETANIAFQVSESVQNPDEMVKQLRDEFQSIKNAKSIAVVGVGGLDSSSNLSLIVNGPNLEEMKKGADQMVGALKQVPGLTDARSTVTGEKPEISIRFDKDKLAENGLTPATVALSLKNMVDGSNIAKFESNGIITDLVLSLKLDVQNDPELLKETKITNSLGQAIPLKNVGTVEQVKNPIKISHLNRVEYLRLNATITDSNTSKVVADAEKALKELSLPEGVTWSSEGVSTEMMKGFINMGIAIGVSVILVLLVMLIAFGEATIPLIILSAIPFSIIGALIGLFLVGEEVGIPAMIGLLMLNGIVVTNAIVLLDRVIQNRGKGLSKHEALIEAGVTRIRPILMTAVATIGALIPMAFTTDGGLISRALAVVVIGGLLTSTLLTLIIVPVLYSLLGRSQRSVKHAETELTASTSASASANTSSQFA